MSTKLTGRAQSFPESLMVANSTQEMDLGVIIESIGEEFVYVKAGAADLIQGRLCASPAPVANHQNLACPVTAVGSSTVTVTLGATAATANQYAEGKLIINAGTGAGQTLRIKSHPAAAGAATLVVTLEDPLIIALDATSKACLQLNPYNGVVINPAAAVDMPVGAAVFPIPAGQFGYLMKRGVVSMLADGAITAGTEVSASNAVAGAVETQVAGQADIGVTRIAAVDTELRPVYIKL